MMPKNLILLHLESISNTILWQYRVELGTIWRLMRESLCYSRFYAGATSTEMAVEYTYLGASGLSDSCPHFRSPRPPSAMLANHLMEHLTFDLGYASLAAMVYFMNLQKTALIKMDLGMSLQCLTFQEALSTADQHIDSALAQNKPFHINFNYAVTHMAFDDTRKAGAKTFSDRFRFGYQSLDESVQQILAMLIQKGQWENTVIACYGDHGDELWTHGLNRGYCHIISPYSSLVWTPFFIYDNGKNAGTTDQLASMIDVKETLLKKLSPGYQSSDPRLHPLRAAPFSGIDLASEKRELAFSQNLFALQLEYDDIEHTLTKGYAVTDGIYRLVVSSGGKEPRNGGLELYCDRLDPSNSRNLLDFFKVNSNGDITEFYPPAEAVSREFSLLFTPEAVRHLTETYHSLKRELYAYVKAKETEALKHHQGHEKHLMPDSAFKYARKRIRSDYQ